MVVTAEPTILDTMKLGIARISPSSRSAPARRHHPESGRPVTGSLKRSSGNEICRGAPGTGGGGIGGIGGVGGVAVMPVGEPRPTWVPHWAQNVSVGASAAPHEVQFIDPLSQGTVGRTPACRWDARRCP